ncbi:MAG: dTMP kinase [Methanocellales archaeon]|nr:dTMP kinase [Methanocellales archaeon]
MGRLQKGILITFEGIDGSGKSTMAKRIAAHLGNDYDITLTTEPTLGWIGDVVRKSIVSDVNPLAELFLFVADHAEHVAKVIKPALDEGKIVISDRYSDSRYAYQGATLADRFANPIDWVKRIHAGWTIPPDLTFLLLVSPSVALKRCNARKKTTKFEDIEFMKKVQANYLKLADESPRRIVKIDAEKDLHTMEEEVMGKIREYIRTRI